MKKIMFYINAIHHGGAERVICNLATRFSNSGYDCVLVTSFRDEWEYSYGEKVRRITLFENQIKSGFLKRNFRLVNKLRTVIKSEQPDVLVSFMAEPNIRSLIAAWGLKVNVVVSVRNDPNREYSNKITQILAKVLFPRARGVVFQTEDAQRWFSKKIQKKSKIIYNQVDETFYSTSFEGVRSGIVTTGRLTSQKNHTMLIRAFSKIVEKIEDNLTIYGVGEEREHLEKLIEDLHLESRVFLPGNSNNVPEDIKSAKLFVLSSDYEGMPNSLMEAMALGLPCISTDCPCGGPRMLFRELGDTCLVPVNDDEALAAKMLTLLKNDELRATIGEQLKKYAICFEPDTIFEEWHHFLLNLCDE